MWNDCTVYRGLRKGVFARRCLPVMASAPSSLATIILPPRISNTGTRENRVRAANMKKRS